MSDKQVETEKQTKDNVIPFEKRETKPSKAQRAIAAADESVKASNFEFFHAQKSQGWCSIPIEDHIETYEVRSRDFKLKIMKILYDTMGDAPKEIVRQVINHFEVIAICGSPKKDVYVRVAPLGGKVYIDVGDEKWTVVEVDIDGWRIRGKSPAKFRRTQGSRALPFPVGGTGAKLGNLVPTFMNVGDKNKILILAWLSYVLAGRSAPFPILSLGGEQGSGKKIIPALINRCQIFRLKVLNTDAVQTLLRRAALYFEHKDYADFEAEAIRQGINQPRLLLNAFQNYHYGLSANEAVRNAVEIHSRFVSEESA